jgi:rod shape-determining protein MreD
MKLARLRLWANPLIRPLINPLTDGPPDESPPINRQPSRLFARAVPWLSIALASLLATLVWVASAPIVPPLGLLALIAWRMLRPGLLPLWAGLPLGFVDDLYSGQPFGSAVLLWSCTMLVIERIELRMRWQSFVVDWAIAATLIAAVLLLGAGIANLDGASTPVILVAPQIVLSWLAYPLVARLVARLDRLRLAPIMPTGRWS